MCGLSRVLWVHRGVLPSVRKPFHDIPSARLVEKPILCHSHRQRQHGVGISAGFHCGLGTALAIAASLPAQVPAHSLSPRKSEQNKCHHSGCFPAPPCFVQRHWGSARQPGHRKGPMEPAQVGREPTWPGSEPGREGPQCLQSLKFSSCSNCKFLLGEKR